MQLVALAALALLASECGAKELGIDPHASDKYKEHLHLDVLASRVNIIEEEHRASGGAFQSHALRESQPAAADDEAGALVEPTGTKNDVNAYKHLAIIVVSESDPSRAYVRVLGSDDEETHHAMDDHEQVTAIWVKDGDGVIVHLTEFDHLHEAEQKAHTALDLAPFQQQLATAEGQQTSIVLTPFAVCKNHGVVSIWKGRSFEVPALPPASRDEL